MSAKPYTFRTLEAPDMFLMFKILGKIGISDFSDCLQKSAVQKAFKSIRNGGDMDKAAAVVGVPVLLEVVNVVIRNMDKCEQDIYQLLSAASDLTVEQVRGLDFVTFVGMVVDFVKKSEFRDFIKVVFESSKPET